MDDHDKQVSMDAEESKLPRSGADEQELLERCDTERDEMTPRETADCAGADLSELYDAEENGGS